MAFISGNREQRPNFEWNRGTKTILWNREHKKANFRFFGNRGTGQFISGTQGNRYPPPGRGSLLAKRIMYTKGHLSWPQGNCHKVICDLYYILDRELPGFLSKVNLVFSLRP